MRIAHVRWHEQFLPVRLFLVLPHHCVCACHHSHNCMVRVRSMHGNQLTRKERWLGPFLGGLPERGHHLVSHVHSGCQ